MKIVRKFEEMLIHNFRETCLKKYKKTCKILIILRFHHDV